MSAATQTTVAVTSPGLVSSAPVPEDARWKKVEGLPCNVSVAVRVPGFTVKDLLALRVQSVIRSELPITASPPLRVNGETIGWCDFEVLGNQLAVRLTGLA